ncbi:MAG: DUF1284 domain-containing protein [Chloroflexi bacterium]|nr:DUF1284 domain-containing protein [Chloroflexota bacterium]
MEVRLRGHHLLCVLGFRGKGYSAAFVENMARVVGHIRLEKDTPVRVLLKPDDICHPCPFRLDDRCRRKPDAEERVQVHDADVMARLGVLGGAMLPWSEIEARIAKHIAPEDLHQICRTCSWLSLGYCTEGVSELKSGKRSARA